MQAVHQTMHTEVREPSAWCRVSSRIVGLKERSFTSACINKYQGGADVNGGIKIG